MDKSESESNAKKQIQTSLLDEDQEEDEQENGHANGHENGKKKDINGKDEEEEVKEQNEGETSESSEPNTSALSPRMSKIVTLLDCGTTEAIKDLIKSTPRLKSPIRSKFKPSEEKLVEVTATAVTSKEREDEENKVGLDDDDGSDEPMEFSDLSDNSRNVWIVTTAALPWRTGTAINPFLRALYMVKRRMRMQAECSVGNNDDHDDDDDATNEKEGDEQDEKNKIGKVTLVIPWLVEKTQSDKLYGPTIITKKGEEGKEQQKQWIKTYAIEKCNMEKEMEHLNILFYPAAYWPAFGSIFPSVDICSLIPNDEADVAILEEPEHLNWFRIPDRTAVEDMSVVTDTARDDDDDYDAGPMSPIAVCGTSLQVPQVLRRRATSTQSTLITDDRDDTNVNSNEDTTNSSNSPDDNDNENNANEDKDNESDNDNESESDKKQHELGWAHKFTFVVGIIHTNYAAYMKQYGIGSSIIGAPAISAMSAMVVRAYCHKVVRLSAVIPSYAKWKEITCNVHGVRGDFLGEGGSTCSSNNDGDGDGDNPSSKKEGEQCAPIYFIGKLLWAKGFDRMLKVQEFYRNSNPDRSYFPIDIYGSGPDETAICRAFLGRLQSSQNSSTSSLNKDDLTDKKGSEEEDDSNLLGEFSSDAIFSEKNSIRKQLHNLMVNDDEDVVRAYSDAKSYINMGFEIVAPTESEDMSNFDHDVKVMERRVLVSDQEEDVVNPFSILSDVSGNVAAAGIATTEAMINLADSAVKTGIAATFSKEKGQSESDNEDNDVDEDILKTKPSFIFDPPKSLFELRRNPIPARFLGVKDHALLRDSPHKIFLNPSVTEVLCTTTAEALAMGKFVIIPDHPSNEFFLQFPNCLAYKNLRECVEKITWALDNEPTPLSEELAHIFTWEAATDRLIESSIISKREAKERTIDGHDKADLRMAWLHSEGGKKGYFIKTLFGKRTKRDEDIDTGKVIKVDNESSLNPEVVGSSI